MDQHEDTAFGFSEEPENMEFLVYNYYIKVIYNDMREVDDITNLGLFIHDKVLLPNNGENAQAEKVIGMSNERGRVPQDWVTKMDIFLRLYVIYIYLFSNPL